MRDRRDFTRTVLARRINRFNDDNFRRNVGPTYNSDDAFQLLGVNDLPTFSRARDVPGLIIRIASLFTGNVLRGSIVANEDERRRARACAVNARTFGRVR